MTKFWRVFSTAFSVWLLGSAALLLAAPSGTIWQSVAICDPWNPTNCIKPAADGSIAVTGGGGGGGGTSSTFGAAFPSTGTAAGMSQGGNMVALTGTSGNLNVQCANCSGSGASGTDSGTFTATTSTFAPSGGFFQTTATNNALTNGKWGVWQLTANRAGFVNLRNSSGAEIGVSAAPVRVDPTGTTTQPISQATASNLNAQVVGNAASGASDSGNPVKIGGAYNSTQPTLTTGQRGDAQLDTRGNLKTTLISPNGVTTPMLDNVTMNDGVANSASFIAGRTFNLVYNAANGNWDRARGDGTALGVPWQIIRDGAGNARSANVDANNRLTVAVDPALSHASTTALGTALNASATAANLYGYNCSAITGNAAGYCIVYNGTAAPSTGALTGANVLDFCYFDNSPRGCSLSRIPKAIAYSSGIQILITSAASPYTYTTGVLTGAITADFK